MANTATLGPKSSSRSSNCGTGYASSRRRRVSTSLGSSMLSMMMQTKMMSEKAKRSLGQMDQVQIPLVVIVAMDLRIQSCHTSSLWKRDIAQSDS